MPRAMPRFDVQLLSQAQDAIDIINAGECVRSHCPYGSVPWAEWHVARLEALYELAYMRLFVHWELFLEASVHRYMCGYASLHGQAMMCGGAYYPTLQSAELAFLSGQQYFLWHNPVRVVNRCKLHITAGRHELVINSNRARLEWFGAIRHRIAHGNADARSKFDSATMNIAGRRYRGSRPGRFLRDWAPGAVLPTRWLKSIADELHSLATQII